MGRLFGTDGVRGLANAELSPELATAVSVAAVRVLAEASAATGDGSERSHGDAGRRRVAVVGRDPRASGEMLEAAVAAGLSSAGADVLRVGVVPTPAVAYLTDVLGADLGVMISASHNPMPDNGIKIFAAGGHKLPDDVEHAIEAVVAAGTPTGRPTGVGVGRVRDVPDAVDRYVEHLVGATPSPLDGLTVVVDCAHGAASLAAPQAYARAGATVIPLHADPDGWNINDGVGSTHLDALVRAVPAHGAHLGIAHDGDADRCLAVAADGTVVDGDQILAVLALDLLERGELAEATLVATVMSNLGLHLAMTAAGVHVRTTGVGDRYVLEELRAGGFSLGGEQSGHVVLPSHATTGDGLLTALRIMARMASTGRALGDLGAVMTRLPQVLVNVPVTDKAAVSASPAVAEAVAAAEDELGGQGRVLLRPSGTEQLVRVMVEAPTETAAGAVADRLAGLVSAVT